MISLRAASVFNKLSSVQFMTNLRHFEPKNGTGPYSCPGKRSLLYASLIWFNIHGSKALQKRMNSRAYYLAVCGEIFF